MKTILCFGDSNTWGYEPGTGDRYGPRERWPGIMRDILGPRVAIVDAGPRLKAPLLLLVAPPPLGALKDLAEMYKDGCEKSRRLSQSYKLEAEKLGCSYFDAGTVAPVSDIDGVHLSRSSHDALGAAV